MAINAGTAFVQIKGDFGPLRAGLRRAESTYSRQVQGMGARLSSTLRTAAKVGGAALVAGAAVGVKKAFDEFEQAEKVTRQTEAALKSTGGAANVSAKEIEDLANAISRKSAVDDEAIQSAENLLLTFTKVRNETGKGNDIFNQATAVIADMSAALGQDFKSSTIQLGKALQDPIKGITALRRVGVNFNAQQSEQVKRMVESGHQLQAQKFILRELNTEFAGSAKAQATSSDRIRVAFDNLFESIGRGFAPAIENALDGLSRFGERVSAILDREDLTGEQKFDRIAGMIVDAFEKGFRAAAEAAARFAPRIAAALVRGFIQAPVLVQLLAGAWLFTKARALLAAFGLLGAASGKAFGTAAAVSAGTSMGPAGLLARLGPGLRLAGGIAGGIFALHMGNKIAKDFSEGGSAWSKIGAAADDAGKALLPLAPRMKPVVEDSGGQQFKDLIVPPNVIQGSAAAVERYRTLLTRMFNDGRLSGEALRDTLRGLDRDLAIRGRFEGFNLGKAVIEDHRVTKAEIRAMKRTLNELPPAARRTALDTIKGMLGTLVASGDLPAQEFRRIMRRLKGAADTGGTRLVSSMAKSFGTVLSVVSQSAAGMFPPLNAALRALGVKPVKVSAKQFAVAGLKLAGGLGQILTGQAQGGFLQGQGRRDTIPIMAAPGEAVLNRHQQAPVETALRTTYGFGLSDLFRREKRPHYMTRGGFTDAPRFARGGSTPNAILGGGRRVTGDTDVTPALLRALEQMARRTGTSIFIQSGRRSVSEQAALYQKYAGSRPVARPSPNAPHVRGVAADITPGREAFGSVAGKYGLGFTVPSESWHIQLLDASKATGGARGDAGVAGIKVQLEGGQVSGPSGALKDLAEAGVRKLRRAANEFLGRKADVPTKGGGTSSSNRRLGRQMSRAVFGDGEWSALAELWQRESGWSHTAENPSSGAYGIPQALPASKMSSAGRDWKSNAATQIKWGLSYIKQRYGSPSAALAFHDAHNWYQRGGFVDEVLREGGFDFRAKPDKEKSTKPKGLKKPPGGPPPNNKVKWDPSKHKWVKRGRRPKLPSLDRLKLLVLDPLNAALDFTIPGIEEQITNLSDSFGDVPDFYPADTAVPRLRREGHNIEKVGDQFIDWSAVETRKGQISQLLGESYKLIGTPFGVTKGWMDYAKNVFPKAEEALNALVKQLKDDIAKIKQKVKDNIARINDLQDKIDKERDKKKGKRDQKKIDKWVDEREKLSDENRRLTGTKEPKGDLNQISEGRLGRQLTRLNEAEETALPELLSDKQGFMGISGLGGDYATQRNDMKRLVDELGTLTSERIRESVTPSQAEKDSQAAADIRAFLASIGDLFKTYGPNFKPIANFAGGGRVEAPIGAPVPATVHGGELIVDPRTGALSVKVVGGVEPSKTINVVNNYQEQPKDPHTWSRNVRFELETAV